MWCELEPTPRTPQNWPLRMGGPWQQMSAAEAQNLMESWRGPSVGSAITVDGVRLLAVTFFAHVRGASAVLLHLSNVTDRHRETLAPSLLYRVSDTDLFAGTFLLPADSIMSYRITDVSGLPDDVGRTRPGWVDIHRRGRPDPGNPLVMPTPLGGDSSIWMGPDARWRGWPTHDVDGWVEVFGPRACGVLPGDERVVVLFDGQFLQHLTMGAALRGAGLGHTVVQIDCGTGDERAAALTSADAAARTLRCGLDAAAMVLRARVERAWAVAGQSFGGLAVAWLLAGRPDLVERGLVQSGSLWHCSGGGGSMDQPGELVRGLRDGKGSVQRLTCIQVGREEDDMVQQARWYRDALAARGATPDYLEVRGGHDYAWWRHGIVEALSRWDADDSPSASAHTR